MTTALSKPQKTIQLYGQSLAPPDRSKHRAWIAVKVEALLSGYWQTTPHEVVKEEILRDWMDVLETFTPDEIREACKKWVIDNPRKKPNYGDIRGVAMKQRAFAEPAPIPAQERTVLSDATRLERSTELKEVVKILKGKQVNQ